MPKVIKKSITPHKVQPKSSPKTAVKESVKVTTVPLGRVLPHERDRVTKADVKAAKNVDNLFDVLSQDPLGESSARDRAYAGILNSTINGLEYTLARNKDLIHELGNLLRPILNSSVSLPEGSTIDFDPTNSSIVNRIASLNERTADQNSLLIALIEALEL